MYSFRVHCVVCTVSWYIVLYVQFHGTLCCMYSFMVHCVVCTVSGYIVVLYVQFQGTLCCMYSFMVHCVVCTVSGYIVALYVQFDGTLLHCMSSLRVRCCVVDPDCPHDPSLVLILKWGGELTPAGKIQAEKLGQVFRCMYPGGEGWFVSTRQGETPALLLTPKGLL